MLRPLRFRDGNAWRELRLRNAEWLRPWEATLPALQGPSAERPPQSFNAMLRRLRAEAREGRAFPWAIELDGALVGQLTVGGIALGSLRSAYIGYWISEHVAGRGVMPTAVAMACDHAFDQARLHRIEINIRPDNVASKRVVQKLGLRNEGLRKAYLHIDGDWRDHETFAVLAGELQPGVLAHWKARKSASL